MKIEDVNEIYNTYKKADVKKSINTDDSMYISGKDWYFSTGRSGIDCILSGLLSTRLPHVHRIMDLPCGYGRVGRHLRAAFPSAEIFFCDIDRSAVDFCATEFHGHKVYSEPDLTHVPLPTHLNVIWVGSLFTHLSRQKVAEWLGYLSTKLSSDGVIVATFHGYFTATNPPPFLRVNIDDLRRQFHETGYGFEAYKSDDYVRLEDYGVSVSKPSAILDIAAAIPSTRVVSYTERGWAANHDVLVLCKDDRLRPFGSK